MARSIYGEGSIFQTKDGTWKGVLEIGKTSDGKRKRRAFYGKSQKEVKTKIKEFKTELLMYGQTDISKLTLAELLHEWMVTIKRHQVKATSYDAIECTVNNQINPYIGYLQISEITPRDIQMHINLLTEKGYAYSVIKKTYNAINASLRYAANRDYIRKNPCIDIQLPVNIKRDKSDIEFFTDEEIDMIIKSALYRHKTGRYMYKHGYGFVILLNTGMRIGELLDIEIKNIHLEERYMIGGLKTEAGRDRVIPIHERIVPLIEMYMQNRKQYLFEFRDEPLKYQTVLIRWRKRFGTSFSCIQEMKVFRVSCIL